MRRPVLARRVGRTRAGAAFPLPLGRRAGGHDPRAEAGWIGRGVCVAVGGGASFGHGPWAAAIEWLGARARDVFE